MAILCSSCGKDHTEELQTRRDETKAMFEAHDKEEASLMISCTCGESEVYEVALEGDL